MADLPTRTYLHYAGIDPGFSGGIGVMNADASFVQVWDMPVVSSGTERTREIDLDGLDRIVRTVSALPDCAVGIEWPTTRPGEGAERSERFGRQKGLLEAFLYCRGLDYFKIAPNLWKGRLGLPGKTDPEARRLADRLFSGYYPGHRSLVRGPRGGLLDGRCDALLVAHFLRTRNMRGMRSVIEQHGADSAEALRLIMGGRSRRRRKGSPGGF